TTTQAPSTTKAAMTANVIAPKGRWCVAVLINLPKNISGPAHKINAAAADTTRLSTPLIARAPTSAGPNTSAPEPAQVAHNQKGACPSARVKGSAPKTSAANVPNSMLAPTAGARWSAFGKRSALLVTQPAAPNESAASPAPAST